MLKSNIGNIATDLPIVNHYLAKNYNPFRNLDLAYMDITSPRSMEKCSLTMGPRYTGKSPIGRLINLRCWASVMAMPGILPWRSDDIYTESKRISK